MNKVSLKMWGVDEIRTIKQTPGSRDCLACVAAMITGTSVNAFKTYCRSHGLCLWDDISLFDYIRMFGFIPGIAFDKETFDRSSGIWLFSAACYLVVESSSQAIRLAGGSHAVLWDGKRVHDPAPTVKGGRLQDYTFHMAFPLTRLIEQGECECGCGSVLFKQVQANRTFNI